MQIRAHDDAVMLSELKVNLGVRLAGHDRRGECIDVDRDFMAVGFRVGEHATEQLQEVEHPVFAKRDIGTALTL